MPLNPLLTPATTEAAAADVIDTLVAGASRDPGGPDAAARTDSPPAPAPAEAAEADQDVINRLLDRRENRPDE